MFRHGDVLIVPTTKAPAVKGRKYMKDNVLMHGEATGHAHRIETTNEDFSLYEDSNGVLHMKLKKKGGGVTHEEHNTICLPPGDYQIKRQREYAPEAPRWVAD